MLSSSAPPSSWRAEWSSNSAFVAYCGWSSSARPARAPWSTCPACAPLAGVGVVGRLEPVARVRVGEPLVRRQGARRRGLGRRLGRGVRRARVRRVDRRGGPRPAQLAARRGAHDDLGGQAGVGRAHEVVGVARARPRPGPACRGGGRPARPRRAPRRRARPVGGRRDVARLAPVDGAPAPGLDPDRGGRRGVGADVDGGRRRVDPERADRDALVAASSVAVGRAGGVVDVLQARRARPGGRREDEVARHLSPRVAGLDDRRCRPGPRGRRRARATA